MQTKFTVTVPDADAARLLAVARIHPALNVHKVHAAVLRIGLRAVAAASDVLTQELTRMAEERVAPASQVVTR